MKRVTKATRAFLVRAPAILAMLVGRSCLVSAQPVDAQMTGMTIKNYKFAPPTLSVPTGRSLSSGCGWTEP